MTAESRIHCRRLLTPDGWLENAALELDECGMIERIAPDSKAGGGCLRGYVIPGMANVHSHAFQRQMAGLGGEPGRFADSFWSWREVMYGLAERITPEHMEAIAAWLQLEMLQAGYTACGEFHYLHHRPGGSAYEPLSEMAARLLSAADHSGISLTLLPVLYCRADFDGQGVAGPQKRFFNEPARYVELFRECRRRILDQGLHRIGIAPHSLRAVTVEQIEEVLAAAARPDTPVHIHVAEQKREVEECRAALGSRPVEWLLDNAPVDPRWTLIHATHLDRAEIRRAAASGALAGLCPTTEADLGDGFFAIEEWLDAGGRFGIGSDSNVRVSASEELRCLENGARLLSGRRNILARDGKACGRFLYEHAAKAGAAALAQPAGTIEVGRRADLVELDGSHPLLEGQDGDAVISRYVFAGDRSMIRSVRVGGKVRVEKGRHPRSEELLRAFRRAMKELSPA